MEPSMRSPQPWDLPPVEFPQHTPLLRLSPWCPSLMSCRQYGRTPKAINAASLFIRFIQQYLSPHEGTACFMSFSHCLTHCAAALRENGNSQPEF